MVWDSKQSSHYLASLINSKPLKLNVRGIAILDKDDSFSLLDAGYSRQEKLLKPFMEVWPYSIHPGSDTVYKVPADPSRAQEVQRFLPFMFIC